MEQKRANSASPLRSHRDLPGWTNTIVGATGAPCFVAFRATAALLDVEGWTEDGRRVAVRLTPTDSPVANYAFDVTPARLVTGLITERGVCPASRAGLLQLFSERTN